MLSYINHELRNPLNGIRGLVDLSIISLENIQHQYKLGELITVVSDLKTSTNCCDLMKHLIDDLLDIRKLEEGKVSIVNESVNVTKCLQEITKLLQPKLNEKPDVIFKIDVFPQNFVITDKHRLTQLLINFISNSIKFTNQGFIHVNVYKLNQKVRFEIVDSGRGIKEEHKHKIFQPFEQLSAEDTTRYAGVGLGLHLCLMLIKLMNGTIGFESEYLKGSTFWFELPEINK